MLFAACGSCLAPEYEIRGKKQGTKFISREFTGDLNDTDFYNKLRRFANKNNIFVKLVY